MTMKVDGIRLILDAAVKETKSLGWYHEDAQSRNKWKIKRAKWLTLVHLEKSPLKLHV